MKYLADQFKKEVGLSVSGSKVVSRSKVVSGSKVALRNSFDVIKVKGYNLQAYPLLEPSGCRMNTFNHPLSLLCC